MASVAKKVVLVTGASSGIGKETAVSLARKGHVVYGAARRADRMTELTQAGGHALALDVTDESQVNEVVQRVLKEAGRIDVLVNNAGYGLYGAVEDIRLDDARRQFEVNVFGVAAMTKAVLPSMRAQKSGRIITVTSMGGKIHTPLGAWYHASKHALEGWSDCLRVETAQFGIDIVIVEPGAIQTEFGNVAEQPMLEHSGDGAYGPMARAVAKSIRATYADQSLSPPSVIANVISQAVSAQRPRTRYVAGKFARMLLFMRRWLSDRMFDRVIMSQVKTGP